jgi:hypothetical protein
VEIVGEGGGEGLGFGFFEPEAAILGPGLGHEGGGFGAFGEAVEGGFGPVGVGFADEGEVEEPFAGVIDDVEM